MSSRPILSILAIQGRITALSRGDDYVVAHATLKAMAGATLAWRNDVALDDLHPGNVTEVTHAVEDASRMMQLGVARTLAVVVQADAKWTADHEMFLSGVEF